MDELKECPVCYKMRDGEDLLKLRCDPKHFMCYKCWYFYNDKERCHMCRTSQHREQVQSQPMATTTQVRSSILGNMRQRLPMV